MLTNLKQFLAKNRDLTELNRDLGIEIVYHPSLPLAKLNYSQIDTPKASLLGRECRGIVVDYETKDIVQYCIPRFFNIQEYPDELKEFNWNDCIGTDKIDGSYVAISKYEGDILITTRGGFADGPIYGTDKTWRKYILETLGNRESLIEEGFAYIFEFVSPETKVVKYYSKPDLYLLTIFDDIGVEICTNWIYEQYYDVFSLPTIRKFYSIDQVYAEISRREATGELLEGYVLRDDKDKRWKVKSSKYVAYHRIRGQGNNLFNPKYIVPLILAGEKDEVLAVYPEAKEQWNKVEHLVGAEYYSLVNTWTNAVIDGTQKDFALSITNKQQTRFVSLLFEMRKEGKWSLEELDKRWKESADRIVKVLYK